MEKLVVSISALSSHLEKQHEDNVKSQKHMLWATYAMAGATAVMAIATVVMAIK